MTGKLAERWCILTTSPGRTILVAKSLIEAGMEAWTPSQTLTRRRARSRKEIEVEVPLAPTFVFVRALHLPDVVSILSSPVSRHPQFSLFRHAGRTPLIADSEMEALRREERWRRDEATVKKLKAQARRFAQGERVRVAEGVLAGWTGVIEMPGRKAPLVNLGFGRPINIEAWMLEPSGLLEEA